MSEEMVALLVPRKYVEAFATHCHVRQVDQSSEELERYARDDYEKRHWASALKESAFAASLGWWYEQLERADHNTPGGTPCYRVGDPGRMLRHLGPLAFPRDYGVFETDEGSIRLFAYSDVILMKEETDG